MLFEEGSGLDMKHIEKIVRILAVVFVMVLSINVLFYKIPESKWVQNSIDSLEKSQDTIMTFSGTTIATSIAISALPDDFASPLAQTISDLNVYFVFMLIIVFVEKLLVVEGIKIALACVIPVACVLYAIYVLSTKMVFKDFAKKLLILAIAVITVIPVSTHFTETVCEDYMDYVDQTIEETEAGADEINNSTSVIQNVENMLIYFKNVVKKCVNSVAIMVVITFVVPLFVMLLFRWLLKELFSLHIPIPEKHLADLQNKVKGLVQKNELISKED